MSETIHHLILSDEEANLLSRAGETLGLISILATRLGGDTADLEHQAQILRDIGWRLRQGSGIRLTDSAKEAA